MNISLDSDLEQFVLQKVESGAHTSAAEVISTVLRLLQKQDEKLTDLRAEIQKGVGDLEAGRFHDGPTTMAKIRERLLRMKPEKA